MNASYRLGLGIVVGTLAVSTLICLATVSPRPETAPGGEDLASLGRVVGPFSLADSQGQPVSSDKLAGRPWIASFIFTRCPSSCPRISKVMKDLQRDLAGVSARLVSITVDPEFDTPRILREFGERYGAIPLKWLFLTGDKSAIHRMIADQFLQSIAERPAGAIE